MQNQTDIFPETVAPPLRRDLTGADAIVPRLARDMVETAIEFGYADAACLRALGWTQAQLDAHGVAAVAHIRDAAPARFGGGVAIHPAERDPRVAAAHDVA